MCVTCCKSALALLEVLARFREEGTQRSSARCARVYARGKESARESIFDWSTVSRCCVGWTNGHSLFLPTSSSPSSEFGIDQYYFSLACLDDGISHFWHATMVARHTLYTSSGMIASGPREREGEHTPITTIMTCDENSANSGTPKPRRVEANSQKMIRTFLENDSQEKSGSGGIFRILD